MKKLLMVAVAAFMFSGVAFAGEGDGKKACCKKGDKKECSKTAKSDKKECDKKEGKKACCSKESKTAKL